MDKDDQFILFESVPLHHPNLGVAFSHSGVGKYAFFAVNSTAHFKLVIGF